MNDWKVRQGDSTPIKQITIKGVNNYTEIEVEGVPAGDITYRGSIVILDVHSSRVVKSAISLAVDPLKGFDVALHPETTQALGVGTFKVVFEISAEKVATSVLEYRKEMDWKVTIEKSLLNE